MKLHYTKPSPYARKVIAAAGELQLSSKIELLEVTTPTMPTNANPALARENPLVKVPVLETDDGERLFDSVVIAEYLDSMAAGSLFPKSGALRWRALKLHALADGAMDAGVLVRLESVRPEAYRWPAWIDAQRGKVTGALSHIEENPSLLEGEFHIGHIALVCALEWLDFRQIVPAWSAGRPRLTQWHRAVAERPSLVSTRPV
jgi:glutathione S-transferase